MIKALGPFKHKPEQPGGMDIPHQDVEVYGDLENKTVADTPPSAEKLMPPAEAPMPQLLEKAPLNNVVPPVPGPIKIEKLMTDTPVVIDKMPPPPVVAATPPAPEPTPPPATVAPAPVLSEEAGSVVQPPVAPSAPPPQKQMVVEKTLPPKHETPAPVAKTAKPTVEKPATITDVLAQVGAGGKKGSVVQLASLPDSQQASDMMKKLQSKFAGLLGGTGLRIVRADLGAKGIYYRVQTNPMTTDKAASLCAAIKQQHGGCFIVRP